MLTDCFRFEERVDSEQCNTTSLFYVTENKGVINRLIPSNNYHGIAGVTIELEYKYMDLNSLNEIIVSPFKEVKHIDGSSQLEDYDWVEVILSKDEVNNLLRKYEEHKEVKKA